MKRLAILICALLLSSLAVEAQVNWTSMTAAASKKITSSTPQLYFVDFSTSWCGWCKKMDKTVFTDELVQTILNKRYVPVHFDAEGSESFEWNGVKYTNTGTPNAKGQKPTHPFTRAVLGQRIGYPSFAIFNSEQGLVTIFQGYQSAYDMSVILWFYASGDYKRYSFENYQAIFDEKIKPTMMKQLGFTK